MAVARARALHLYRRAMRLGRRTWPGPDEEKQYIREEVERLYRRNQHLTDPTEIEKRLREAEVRALASPMCVCCPAMGTCFCVPRAFFTALSVGLWLW